MEDIIVNIQNQINQLIDKIKADLATQNTTVSKPGAFFWPKVKNFLGKLWHGNNWKEGVTLESYSYINEISNELTKIISEELSIDNINGALDQLKKGINSILFNNLRRAPQYLDAETAKSAQEYINSLNIPKSLKNKDSISTFDVSRTKRPYTKRKSKEEPEVAPTTEPKAVEPEVAPAPEVKTEKPQSTTSKSKKTSKHKKPKKKKIEEPKIIEPVSDEDLGMNINIDDILDPHDETGGGLFGS